MYRMCENCGNESQNEFIVVQKPETILVKGTHQVNIVSRILTCAHCNEEIFDEDLESENLRNAYAQYRRIAGLLQPEEIKEIRQQYGISQVTFARVLGLGDKTIARYETGSLQDNVQNNVILLAKYPHNFSLLFEKNLQHLTPDEQNRIRSTLGRATTFVKWEAGANERAIATQTGVYVKSRNNKCFTYQANIA